MAGGGGVFTGRGATVVMFPAPLVYVEVFHTGSGPDRHIRKKAVSVANTARYLAPRKTGRMASTIKVEQNRDEKGRFAFGYKVSASTPYVVFVHEGTKPSPRWPNSRKVMRWNGQYGDTAYRDFVMHPGTPAQPFLQNALVGMVGP